MPYPDPGVDRRFRLYLGSALLYLSVSVIVLGILVWHFAEWGLDEVRKSPEYDDGKPFAVWDFLGGVFLACLISPLLGLGYEPALRHLALARRMPMSAPLAAAVAVPFWYAAFLPTYVLLFDFIDKSTRVLLLCAPLACALLTGILHLLMVHYMLRTIRGESR